jgi:predicted site-specific integrase-resolvase
VAERLLTPEDLAGRYVVAKSTILEWFHAGLIPAEVAVGKIYRFDGERVAAALREAQGTSARGGVPVI